MSKRPFKPFGIGAEPNKLPKLEVTISEHNFPLSQNFQQRSSPRDAAPADVWGDDNDDDLLLQASQACEQQNLSAVPDYSAWIQNPSTSTQIHTFSTNQSDISQIHAGLNANNHNFGQQKNNYPTSSQSNLGASTSKANLSVKKRDDQNSLNFQFKKPTAKPVGKVSNTSGMKDKCNGIALPISGICGNVKENERDELLVLDNMKEDSEHFHRRMLQVQEENARLKSENSKLLEQALSKDGEVTILRGRLKSSQAAVDSARMERLRAGERTQVEWSDKMAAMKKEVSSLTAQLDFKDLEVVRIKEKCRQLETNKVKLSQMAPTQLNSTHTSQRRTINNNFSIHNDMNATLLVPHQKCKVSASAQTDEASYSIKLNVAYRSSSTNLSRIVPLLLEPESEQQTVFQDIGADFSAQPADAEHFASKRRKTSDLKRVYEEMSRLATVKDWGCLDEGSLKRCLSILVQVKAFLTDVLSELESASRKVTSAFKRELDSKYTQEVNRYTPVDSQQLFGGQCIFKEENAITARRGVAVVAALCPLCTQLRKSVCAGDEEVISLMSRVTSHVAAVSCALQYSGLLLSFVFLIQSVVSRISNDSEVERLASLVKDIVIARPSLPVICAVLPLLRILALRECGLKDFCTDSQSGNLKLDSDQGLVSFNKESCFLQVLLSQLETCVKCTERQGQAERVVSVARGIISLYRNADALNVPWCHVSLECRCKCSKRLAQVMVYSLQVCARELNNSIVKQAEDTRLHKELLAVCRCGIAILYLWTLKEAEFRTLLGHYEGRYLAFVDLCNEMKQYVIIDEVQGHVLSELLASIQPNPEELETPSAPVRKLWLDNFSQFHIND